jgi:arginine utilization protein RocB
MNADFTANQDNHIVTSPAKTVELSEPSDSHLERGESMGEEKEDVKIHLKGIGQISYLATKEESKVSIPSSSSFFTYLSIPFLTNHNLSVPSINVLNLVEYSYL